MVKEYGLEQKVVFILQVDNTELSLTYTDKTAEVVSGVAAREADREDMVSTLPKWMQERIVELENKYLD